MTTLNCKRSLDGVTIIDREAKQYTSNTTALGYTKGSRWGLEQRKSPDISPI